LPRSFVFINIAGCAFIFDLSMKEQISTTRFWPHPERQVAPQKRPESIPNYAIYVEIIPQSEEPTKCRWGKLPTQMTHDTKGGTDR
jgi:hypothetical protein